MKITLTTIVIVASISPVAFAGITITAPNILVSDENLTGSFEVFVDTDGETPAIGVHQTRLTLDPVSGITFTGAELTVDHTPILPGSTGLIWSTADGGATIDVGDSFAGPPNLFDGAGLFKVNFDLSPGSPPYPIFNVAVSTNPAETFLLDGAYQPLPHATSDGEIQIEQSGPHMLRVELHGDAVGNWANSRTLLLTYGEEGATSGRTDIGVNGDVTTGWGNDKFAATSVGDFGVYTRGAPFGSGDDMLVRDARPLTDTTANVLVEAYTNKVLDEPSEWIVGDTWNEGGTLEFTIESSDKTYFDDFQIVQREPGRFLEHTGAATDLGSILDANGHGSFAFDRIGCDWLGDTEIDWWAGPFASFDLIPPDGVALPEDPDAPISVEPGTFVIGHPHTPEPSSLMVLAIAGFGACARRRKFRRAQG